MDERVEELQREDFQGARPYEMLYAEKDPFLKIALKDKLEERAKEVGFKKFNVFNKNYLLSLKQQTPAIVSENPTAFSGQPMELEAGNWRATDAGVEKMFVDKPVFACMHPIMPVERFVNVDTGEQRLKLAFRLGEDPNKWSDVVVEKSILASATKVTDLARFGIAVNSQNAKAFIQYLSEIETINYSRLPEKKSVGRLGVIGNGEFSPYVGDLYFDGDASFGELFRSVRTNGDYQKWREIAMEAAKDSMAARIMLAASFASVLIEPVGALPFFAHLWSVESGTGKTVALMLAASVWGDPAPGSYVKTFDSTVVGMEKTAAFLNSLPMCLDELQLSKDTKGKSNFNVYRLAQGVGRTRGNKYGGVDQTPRWRNCILTTGESPLSSLAAGAGAVNRVLDIECPPGKPVIKDGSRISGGLRQNYGFAGKDFVQWLYGKADRSAIQGMYKDFYEMLCKGDTTEKQAMAAAVVLLADQLMCARIFDCELEQMDWDEFAQCLATKEEVSAGQRAYDFLCGWVAQNAAHFDEKLGLDEMYGRLTEKDPDHVYITRLMFRKVLTEQGFDPKATTSWLKQQKLIEGRNKKNLTKGIRIGHVLTECYYMKLPEEQPGDVGQDDDVGQEEELPF